MVSLRLIAVFVVLGFVAGHVSAQGAYPAEAPAYSPPSYPSPAPAYKPAPAYANGRVKIQAYRGPNKEYGKGYDKEGAFAPWGFYVNQPEDNKPYYGKQPY